MHTCKLVCERKRKRVKERAIEEENYDDIYCFCHYRPAQSGQVSLNCDLLPYCTFCASTSNESSFISGMTSVSRTSYVCEQTFKKIKDVKFAHQTRLTEHSKAILLVGSNISKAIIDDILKDHQMRSR